MTSFLSIKNPAAYYKPNSYRGLDIIKAKKTSEPRAKIKILPSEDYDVREAVEEDLAQI